MNKDAEKEQQNLNSTFHGLDALTPVFSVTFVF